MGKMGQSTLFTLHSTLCRNLGTKHILKIISFYYILVGSGSGSGQRPLREPLGKAFSLPFAALLFSDTQQKKGLSRRGSTCVSKFPNSTFFNHFQRSCFKLWGLICFLVSVGKLSFHQSLGIWPPLEEIKKSKRKKAKITTKLMSPGGAPFWVQRNAPKSWKRRCNFLKDAINVSEEKHFQSCYF